MDGRRPVNADREILGFSRLERFHGHCNISLEFLAKGSIFTGHEALVINMKRNFCYTITDIQITFYNRAIRYRSKNVIGDTLSAEHMPILDSETAFDGPNRPVLYTILVILVQLFTCLLLKHFGSLSVK